MSRTKGKNQKNCEEESAPILPIETFQAQRQDKELEIRGIIFIEDEITKRSLASATRKLATLHFNEDFKDQIQLVINSPGGNCDAGWAFIDLMSWCKNPIRTIALGEIASMATNIFIAGDHRIMGPNCSAMIHQFYDYGEGTYGDLVARQKGWEIGQAKEIRHLIRCSKYKTESEVKKKILKEHDHWMSPEDMKKHGMCDEIFVLPPRGKNKTCR
jgi:ATP-dependent Clp protease protease subunit